MLMVMKAVGPGKRWRGGQVVHSETHKQACTHTQAHTNAHTHTQTQIYIHILCHPADLEDNVNLVKYE